MIYSKYCFLLGKFFQNLKLDILKMSKNEKGRFSLANSYHESIIEN